VSATKRRLIAAFSARSFIPSSESTSMITGRTQAGHWGKTARWDTARMLPSPSAPAATMSRPGHR
jgi:hypothetical protein